MCRLLVSSFAIIISTSLANGSSISALQSNHVQSGTNANTVYNSAFNMEVASRGGNSNRKVYLKWDIDGALGAGEIFSDVSIDLTFRQLIVSGSGVWSYSLYGITDGNSAWTPSTLTWNNAPKNTNTGTLFEESGVVLLGTVALDVSTLTDLDVISFSGETVDNFFNWAAGLLGDFYGTSTIGDSSPTLMLAASAGTSMDPGLSLYSIRSANASAHPSLSYTAIPEPRTTAIIFGFLAVGLCMTKKINRSKQTLNR